MYIYLKVPIFPVIIYIYIHIHIYIYIFIYVYIYIYVYAIYLLFIFSFLGILTHMCIFGLFACLVVIRFICIYTVPP